MERIQEQNKLCANVRRSLKVQEIKDQRFDFEEEQMLQQQSEDLSSVLTFKDPSFLALLSLQSLEKPWELENYHHEVPNFHYYQNPSFEDGVNETVISSQELPLNTIENENPRHKRKNDNMNREKRKRKRTKPTKNMEELENQRMTHIAVERNRRRLMNIHLNSLRSLIPPSYIQRGDQASIVGGAIDFVKILEQHLQSLEAQKITQESEIRENSHRDISSNKWCASKEDEEGDENSSELKIDATVIESHVNLKIQCPRRQGQLLRSIILLEKLRFSVLHLNITSPSNTTVSYSFNLKMGDDCNFGTADEITAAVRRIFDYRFLD